MTLILTNAEIESIFTLDECFAALEPALIDLGSGKAVNMPRQDLLVPGAREITADDEICVLHWNVRLSM